MTERGWWMRTGTAVPVVALAVFLVAAAAIAGPPAGSLRALSIDHEAGRPVVVLTGEQPLRHEAFLLDNPYRLVIDLPDTVDGIDAERFRVDDTDLVQVRVGQFRWEPRPVCRVVFDMIRPLAYEVRGDGDRLVVSFGEPQDEASVAIAGATTLPEWTRASWSPAAVEPDSDPVGEVLSAASAEAAEPVEIARTEAPAVEPDPAPEAPAAPVDSPPVAAVTAPAKAEKAPVADRAQPSVRAGRSATTEQQAWSAARKRTATAESVAAAPAPSRALDPERVARLARSPRLAAEQPQAAEGESALPRSFQTQTIVTESRNYTGRRITLNLVDANVKEVFRLFHEISGINFVLDPSVEGRVTIVVDDVPWDQALDLILKNNGLDKVLENNVIRIATTEKLAQEAAQRKELKEAKELEVEPITITRTLSYAKAKDVERVIRDGGVLSQRGKVIVDERTNTLIVSDIPKKVEPLDRLISTLDAETPQVMIEARVVETSRDFEQNLGVVWGLNAIADASRGTSTGLGFPSQASVRYGLNLPSTQSSSTLSFSFGNIIDSFTLDLALNTLEQEGQARILSSPKIATQNNERAEIEQGVRIPVVNTTATEINVEFVAASLRMEVTPQITAEGTIILDIVVENNAPDFVQRVGDVPAINTQRAQTKVLISDGGTTVIGGIFTVNEGSSETGVPWFRKVPVFGWLFKSQNITRRNRELLIFITPKILKLG